MWEKLIAANMSLLASLASLSRLRMTFARWPSAWTGHFGLPERRCSGLKDQPNLGSAPIDAAEDRCQGAAESDFPHR